MTTSYSSEYLDQIKQEWVGWKHDENSGFEPKCIRALASKVLMVAVWRIDGWVVYCDAVPGIHHDQEYLQVAQLGVKIEENIARAAFPQYGKISYIR